MNFVMDKRLSLLLFLIISCDTGIEGYVDESILITAENPTEGEDVDFNWSLLEQPDGSLINSSDLETSDDGQKMNFSPDYPGDYNIEVIVSQYGDEISSQAFSFSIIDAEKKVNQIKENNDNQDEEWLNESLEDDILITEDEDEYEYEDEDEDEYEYEDEDDLEEKFYNDTLPVDSDMGNNLSELSTNSLSKISPKNGNSIPAKTDLFTIQITSKQSLQKAQLFAQEMISNGYDAYIQKAIFDTNNIWYRVRVGSYDDYQSAKSAADDLSKQIGITTWVDFVRIEQ